jgi:cytochrome c oxidase assembly protein subunit 11
MENKPKKSNTSLVLNILAVVIGMFGLAYASVPLYSLFCKTTGFGGTTQEAKKIPDKIIDRDIRVLFNTEVSSDLAWKFKPLQRTETVKVGETKLAFFEAENIGTEPIVGMAMYNVTPGKMGAYFDKVQCFCFNQQLIKPHQKVTFPVSFFIDPAIMNDKTLDDVSEVTLSYTFFKYKDQSLAQKNTKN